MKRYVDAGFVSGREHRTRWMDLTLPSAAPFRTFRDDPDEHRPRGFLSILGVGDVRAFVEMFIVVEMLSSYLRPLADKREKRVVVFDLRIAHLQQFDDGSDCAREAVNLVWASTKFRSREQRGGRDG